jgi:hypothetical protein
LCEARDSPANIYMYVCYTGRYVKHNARTSVCSARERYEYGAESRHGTRDVCGRYQEYLVSRKSAVVRAMVTVDRQALYCADSCFAPTFKHMGEFFHSSRKICNFPGA